MSGKNVIDKLLKEYAKMGQKRLLTLLNLSQQGKQ